MCFQATRAVIELGWAFWINNDQKLEERLSLALRIIIIIKFNYGREDSKNQVINMDKMLSKDHFKYLYMEKAREKELIGSFPLSYETML